MINLKNNLQERLFVGIIGVIILISGIYYSHWCYFILFMLVSSLSLWEFYTLIAGNGHLPLKLWGSFCGILLYIVSYLIVIDVLPFIVIILVTPFFFVSFLSRLYKKNVDVHFSNIGYTFLGVFYCCFPFTLLHLMSHTDSKYNYEFIIGILFLHWASDTGAYFVGKIFGKLKLFERISPNKTWEGSIGGLVLALIVAYVLSVYFTEIAFLHWISIAVLIVVFGTYGDLVESLFKRELEIKDSGRILLGHGGFLDRFDGFFMSLPFITIYQQFIM